MPEIRILVIPIEPLMVFLADIASPVAISFRVSKSNADRLFIYEGNPTHSINTATYTLSNNQFAPLTPGWKDMIQTLHEKGPIYDQLKRVYPHLFSRYDLSFDIVTVAAGQKEKLQQAADMWDKKHDPVG